MMDNGFGAAFGGGGGGGGNPFADLADAGAGGGLEDLFGGGGGGLFGADAGLPAAPPTGPPAPFKPSASAPGVKITVRPKGGAASTSAAAPPPPPEEQTGAADGDADEKASS